MNDYKYRNENNKNPTQNRFDHRYESFKNISNISAIKPNSK